jgi:hypothetical protein
MLTSVTRTILEPVKLIHRAYQFKLDIQTAFDRFGTEPTGSVQNRFFCFFFFFFFFFFVRLEKWGFANFFKKETQPTTFDNEDLSWMDLDP